MTANKDLTLKYLSEMLPRLFQELENHCLQSVSNALVQVCIYPRILHSAKDALFTIHFFKLLCTLKVPNFNILYVLSAILKNIVPVMHCCSEAEAESLGIYFSELFALLNHWSKRVNWTRECAGNLAFCRKFQGDQCISFEDFTEKIVENFGKRFAI